MDLSNNIILMAVLGGAMIGLAAGLLSVITGRVMSASGMIGSLLGGAEGVAATSIAFIGGIVIAPTIVNGLGFALDMPVEASLPFLVLGGLLVGVGARLSGSGLGAAITALGRRSRDGVVLLGAILVGATTSLVLRQILAGTGAA